MENAMWSIFRYVENDAPSCIQNYGNLNHYDELSLPPFPELLNNLVLLFS
jgi:hypothetical protein